MNEHVKELVEKAGFELALVPGGKDSEFYYEDEFAALVKLVVKECAKLADAGYASDNFGNGITGKQLLRHFGIEK